MSEFIPDEFSKVFLCCGLVATTALMLAHTPSSYALGDSAAIDFIDSHCYECHDADDPKGEFSLEDLGEVTVEGWQGVLEQIAIDEMPPKKKKKRPGVMEREAMLEWVAAKIEAAGGEPRFPGGPRPEDGNLLDHDRLFSAAVKGPASSPPRFWRRSQPQYDALMEQLLVIPKLRYEKASTRDDPEWAAYSYSKPFPALDPESFTDYASEVNADDSALRALMDAGAQIAERLTAEKLAYSEWIQPWRAVGMPHLRKGHPWEKFRLEPPARAREFEPFLVEGATPTSEERSAAIGHVFGLFLDREPTADEQSRYGGLLQRCIARSGAGAGLRGLITAVVVSPEFVFRMEVGMGERDQHGRRMLSPDELVYAISYALTDDGPDDVLREAARTGKLETKTDVEREVRRILSDEGIEKHRRLRFFQEFFGYHRAGEVFKDEPRWKFHVRYLIRDADMLVEHILDKDKNVFRELLTADRYFVALPAIDDPELFDAVIERTKTMAEEGIKKTLARGKKIEPSRQGHYSRTWAMKQGYALIPNTVHNDAGAHEQQYIGVYGFDKTTFNWTRDQPITVPGRRAGLLTHPAWLAAHSSNFDNDVVGRGHWIREHLLAGKIPNVPIEVEAKVPEEPDRTFRERMWVTREAYCLRCHERMDPLGFPFEIYDHYGRYREQEMVGSRKNKPKPIDASGEILYSGESELDGPVEDAIDLVHKLAKSPRVRQSIIRHAFRFWMGRNEVLGDSPTLITADQAYVASGGSFDELLVSLLTSDSFLYRK